MVFLDFKSDLQRGKKRLILHLALFFIMLIQTCFSHHSEWCFRQSLMSYSFRGTLSLCTPDGRFPMKNVLLLLESHTLLSLPTHQLCCICYIQVTADGDSFSLANSTRVVRFPEVVNFMCFLINSCIIFLRLFEEGEPTKKWYHRWFLHWQ